MKHLTPLLLIVLIASCRKEILPAEKFSLTSNAATAATPLVELVSFTPENHRDVTSGSTVRLFTLVLRVSGAPVDFKSFTVSFWDTWQTDIKRRVLRVDNLVFPSARIKPYPSLVWEPSSFPGLRYDWSAKPIKLGIGDHIITLKSEVDLQAGKTEGKVTVFIEGYWLEITDPQTGNRFRSIPSIDPANNPSLEWTNYLVSGSVIIHPK
jgi:hypothetical protein